MNIKTGLLLATVILIAGCQKKQETQLDFSNIRVDKTVNYLDNEKFASCQNIVDIDFPIADSGKNNHNLAKILIGELFGITDSSLSIEEAIDNYVNSKDNEFNNLDEGLLKDSDHSHQMYNYLYGKIIYKKSCLMSYNIVEESMMAYAHPQTMFYYLNYDLKNNKKIFNEDIFGKDYKNNDKLKELLLNTLIKQEEVSSKEELDLLPEESERFLPVTPFIYFDKDYVCFSYNPYDIMPYYRGQIIIKVSYREIEPLISKDFFNTFLK